MEKQDTFRAVVLIPAYKPDERLVQLTRELKEEKLDVLLVDDGGQQAFAHIFDECRALGAEVAVHAVNQGKGRALKTGLNAALNLWPDLSGVVTADADGQHTLRDILRLIEAMREHPNALVLGSREFTGDVPFKSRWGNRITRFVYALASGVHVSDTQTGLRGLPACAIPAMITIDGERYEYEMNVLLKLRDMKLGVFEVPIETIYIDDNSGSHFNPVRDAIRIYAVIFKYLFSSVTSFAVDYLLYWLCLGVFKIRAADQLRAGAAGVLTGELSPQQAHRLLRPRRQTFDGQVLRAGRRAGASGRGAGAGFAGCAADLGGGGQNPGRSSALCGQLLHSARLCV